MLVAVRERLVGHGHRGRGDRAGRSTSGASTRRWSCGARSSTTSTTSSASASSSPPRRTAGPRSAAIHAIWPPVQGRFKDYINTPKFNLYQSLHTTVIGLDGKPIEVQVRTHEMHRRAEYGIAAHWGYKEQGATSPRPRWPGCSGSPTSSRRRRPGRVPRGAEARPRAGRGLRLHAEGPGHRPAGPVDAGRLRLRHPHRGRPPLHRRPGERPAGPAGHDAGSADTVEIFTSKSPTAGPSRDWLQIVASSRARNKIRQWFSRERREDAIETGREELAKALRREGLPLQKIMALERAGRRWPDR